MAENELVKFIQLSHRVAANDYLKHYTDYVKELEEEVDKLRKITQNPEAEMARLREENSNLKRQLAIKNNYSFSTEQRVAAESWIRAHNEIYHENGYLDYSYILTPTCLDNLYECKCNRCGATKEL